MERRMFLGRMMAAPVVLAAPERPNIVVILTDDQGIGDVGCYGHEEARTPNLDRLARSGVRFTQGYANAPICSASRASIMTGKYSERTGISGALLSKPSWDVEGLRAGEQTLASRLKGLGYRTGAFGKWHLGSAVHSRPYRQGFDEFFGWYSGWLDAYSHRYYQLAGNPGMIFHDLWKNEEEVFYEPEYMTELLGRQALEYVRAQKRSQPFFLYLAFGAPHYSMMAPKRYESRFPAGMERDRRTHLAMVAAVDDVVGSVLDEIERQGIADETVIWFQSDNGATREQRASSKGLPNTGGSNAPYRGYKQGLFDGGMHVPMLLRAPGVTRAGQVWERPVMGMDLLPTLVELAGGGAVSGVDGQSLVGVLRGERREHEEMFWSFGNGRAARMGDWKLIENPPQFPGEEVRDRIWLSNLEADPGERRNLAGEEGARVQKMLERIRAWEKGVGLEAPK